MARRTAVLAAGMGVLALSRILRALDKDVADKAKPTHLDDGSSVNDYVVFALEYAMGLYGRGDLSVRTVKG